MSISRPGFRGKPARFAARMPRMPQAQDPYPRPASDDVSEIVGHPRGTLAIVVVFAILFAAGWFAMFLFRFMEQGAPHSH
jgi:hypothetical protein